MKVTCSSVKVREKLDLLGESHDKEILDFKKMMCEAHQLVTEKEARVSLLTDKCGAIGHICNDMCVQQKENAKQQLEQARMSSNSGIAIIFYNIDGKLERRHMSKDNQNFDFHWVNHKIVLNRVVSKRNNFPRDLLAVSNITFLPSVKDQHRQRYNFIVLVARMLVQHLECFAEFKDVCVSHIPHKYSKELAKKSESVSISV